MPPSSRHTCTAAEGGGGFGSLAWGITQARISAIQILYNILVRSLFGVFKDLCGYTSGIASAHRGQGRGQDDAGRGVVVVDDGNEDKELIPPSSRHTCTGGGGGRGALAARVPHHRSGGPTKGNTVWILNALTTTARRQWRHRNGGVKTAAWRTFRRRSALHRALEDKRVTVQGPVKKPPMGYMSRGGIWYGELWHRQLVPHFALVFKDRGHLLRCRGGLAGHGKYSPPWTSGMAAGDRKQVPFG